MRWIQTTFQILLDVIFPVECLVCGTPGTYACPTCLDEQIPQMTHLPEIELLFSASSYDTPAQQWITALKYHGVQSLALPLGQRMAEALPLTLLSGMTVVPLPLHPRRERERGFNQALLLAQVITTQRRLSIDPHLLTRSRYTPPQVKQEDRKRRRANLAGAFITSVPILPRHILLVDDVTTTGATLEEAARTLRAAGCQRIWAVTYAIKH
jgi:ComF family protein